jgi:hypothetical protein
MNARFRQLTVAFHMPVARSWSWLQQCLVQGVRNKLVAALSKGKSHRQRGLRI